jgi:DNA-binding GntR family transcriptional regulator
MQAENARGATALRLSRIARRPTLRDTIITHVREAIACGELKAGERVTELGLAKSLGVAQATIREAFIELESQGFLERQGARLTCVSALTRKQISEIHLVRSRLEALVVEVLADMADKNLTAAAEACAGMLSSALENEQTGFYHNDLEFHRSLWLATDNRYLAATLELLTAKLFAFGLARRAEQSRERLITTAEEHRQLLNLISSNQRNTALDLLMTSLKRAWTEDLQFRER